MRSRVTRRPDSYMPDTPREIRCPYGRSYKQHEPSLEETMARIEEKKAELNKRVWQKIQEEVAKS